MEDWSEPLTTICPLRSSSATEEPSDAMPLMRSEDLIGAVGSCMHSQLSVSKLGQKCKVSTVQPARVLCDYGIYTLNS